MLKQLIYELGRGLAYRSIAHADMHVYTRWLPSFVTLLIVVGYIALPIQPAISGEKGLAASILTLVSTLPGFYFAGLAAVATFGSLTMDHELPAPAPEITMRIRGQDVPVKLTRRLFLSYLFSYLVVLSLIICLALVTLNISGPLIALIRGKMLGLNGGYWLWPFLKGLVGSVLVFGFASMIVSTLHGIFFLTEKIHQP